MEKLRALVLSTNLHDIIINWLDFVNAFGNFNVRIEKHVENSSDSTQVKFQSFS